MANANTPIGLEARQDNTAAGWDGSANLYYIPRLIRMPIVSGTRLFLWLVGILSYRCSGSHPGWCNAAMTTGSLRGAIIGIGTAAGTAGMAVPGR